MINLNAKKERIIKLGIEENWDTDAYGTTCLFNLLLNPEKRKQANKKLSKNANWFRLPHPTMEGRDLKGEPDFVSIRMLRTLFLCEEYIEDYVKADILKFFLNDDFESKYKSENHILLFRVSRFLAAQKFENSYFNQYSLSSEDIIRIDKKYLISYLKFRAKRGWAEFDSLNYAPEIIICLLNLFDFSNDEELKILSEMSLNLLLLDMIADCMGPLYCGAHGRSYENAVLDYKNSGMYEIYKFYFVENAEIDMVLFAPCTSSFVPADYVYAAIKSKPETYENFESKHLHSISMAPPQREVAQVEGSINKYTFITPNYAIGAVNYQDPYPEDSEASWYSHHQQHEWDLTLKGGTDIRIFTHHPGSFGTEGKEHGYWTGDLCCLCGQVFCNKNILLATYDINENETQFIHANVPLKYFNVIKDDKYLFLAHNEVYVSLWFSNGYYIVEDGPYARNEVISDGNKHGFVCHVGTKGEYADFNKFISNIKENEIYYDTCNRVIEYCDLKMSEHERFISGDKVMFPYNTYESPILFEEFNSGIVHVKTNEGETILDFN